MLKFRELVVLETCIYRIPLLYWVQLLLYHSFSDSIRICYSFLQKLCSCLTLLIGHLDIQVHIIHERKKELASIKNYKWLTKKKKKKKKKKTKTKTKTNCSTMNKLINLIMFQLLNFLFSLLSLVRDLQLYASTSLWTRGTVIIYKGYIKRIN